MTTLRASAAALPPPRVARPVAARASNIRVLARLWPYARPHRGALAWAMLLVPATSAVELLQPYLVMVAIDHCVARRTTDGLGAISALYVVAAVVHALMVYAQGYAFQLVGQRTLHGLRLATYEHALSRSSAFFDRTPVGRLVTRMTDDVDTIQQLFTSGIGTMVLDGAKVIGITVAMFALSPRMAAITFAAAPVVFVVWWRVGATLRASFRAVRAHLASLNTTLQEHLLGVKVVQVFGREREATRAYAAAAASYRHALLTGLRAELALSGTVEAVYLISIALVLGYASVASSSGAVTVGLVVAFVEYVTRLFFPLKELPAKYSVLQSAAAALERIVMLHDVDDADAPAVVEGATRTDPDAPLLAFRSVRFAYRADTPVLRGITLDVRAGETLAIVGATGSGKSSLIKLLLRLYDPQAGAIELDGRDLRTFRGVELRERIAVVSQEVLLFAGTVADNVRVARPEATDAEIEAALAAVGADRALARRGRTIHDRVLERGANFSAGERQLLAFARALVKDPELLVLDEATAHVDPEAEAIIEEALPKLMAGRTTLVIAHRLSTVRRANRIVVMSGGRIVESGTRQELLARGGAYAALEASFHGAEAEASGP